MDYRFEDNCAWSAARRFLSSQWSESGEKRVLDIGCHTGAFLAGLPPQWSRFGVESAETPIVTATAANAVTVLADRIETIGQQWNASFDAVTLFDVVEHLPDPASGLARAAELVRPNGFLLVSTADLDAWTWRLAKGRHWYLQSALHLCVGSEGFFRHVAERNGLRLAGLRRIPHRRGNFRMRWNEYCEAVYWELKQRGGAWRLPQRIMHSVPGLRRLRHRQSTPWTMRLKDHVFLVLTRLPVA